MTEPMHGCYGLRLRGVPGAGALLGPLASPSPALTVILRGPAVDLPQEHVDLDSAGLKLQGGGAAVLDRRTGTTTLRMADAEQVPHEHVVHPFLSTSVAVMSRWHGRDAFHAGAFVTDTGAWAVLGDKGQGKSTLLALLALGGITVLSDDLVVVENGLVHRGPRCIDLRADAAAELREGEDLGIVGARHRARLRLGAAPAAVPLRGWIVLEWGDTVEVTSVPVQERLPMLFRNLALRLVPPSMTAILGHLELPFVRLTRPRSWSAVERSVAALDAAIAA